MLIDWFTVVAQALNFLILVWLLRRFAYGPVLEAINQREQRIAKQMAVASAAQLAAVEERERLSRRNAELEQQRAALLDQMTAEAKVIRSRLLDQARLDADAQRTRALATLGVEQAQLRSELGAKVREEVLEIVGSMVRDLAQVTLNDAMVDVFLQRLQELSDRDRQLLNKAAAGDSPAVVRSAFELVGQMRERIRAAVASLGTPDPHIRFETARDLMCGIELQAAGHKVAWSVGDYLERLQAATDAVLSTDIRSRRASVEAAAP